MALTSKQGVRPQKLTRPKQVAHPTTRTPLDGPDPLGFGTKLAKIIAEMQNAYRAPLRASLDEFAPKDARCAHGAGTSCEFLGRDYHVPRRCVRLSSCGRHAAEDSRRQPHGRI